MKRVHKGGRSTADKIRDREEVCDRILVLLEEKPRMVAEIMDITGIGESAACRYLRFLCEMGEVCRSEDRGPSNRRIWQLGREGAPPEKRTPTGALTGAKVVPARQIGVQRDPWDVAFFGPARA